MRRIRDYKNITACVVFILFTFNLVGQSPLVPVNLRLKKVTFTKISIMWEPAADSQSQVKYLILRNGKKVRITKSTYFTDNRLAPNRTYRYSIVAINSKGKKSGQTSELKVKTLESLSIDSKKTIQKTVDYFHSKGSKTKDFEKSMANRVATLKNSKIFDVGLIKDMISSEVKWIKSPVKKLTAEELVKEKQALDKFLKDNYAGESFFKVYLQAKLIELGDKHLLKKNYKGAEVLYKAALGVSSKVEIVVSIILNSLAKVHTAQINKETAAKDAIKHLKKAEKYYLKFSKYFPKSNSHYTGLSYTLASFAWTHFFPQLLNSKNYNRVAYDSALKLAELALKTDSQDSMKGKRISRIKKWNLVSLRVFCYKEAKRPAHGKITIKNVDKKLINNLPPDHVLLKEYQYKFRGRPVKIPVYSGRKYDITIEVKLPKAPSVKKKFSGITFKQGTEGIYYRDRKPTLKTNRAIRNNAKITFIIPKPLVPYNLRLEDGFKSSTLCWDWIPPTKYFKLKYFKVYCDGKEISKIKSRELTGISRDFEGVYKVKAFGIKGKMTKFSLPFEVISPSVEVISPPVEAPPVEKAPVIEKQKRVQAYTLDGQKM